MTNSTSLAHALTALRAAQSLLSWVNESSSNPLSALRQKALLESALFQAYLGVWHYCRTSADRGAVQDALPHNAASVQSILMVEPALLSPQLTELQGLLSEANGDLVAASWLDYLLNQYHTLWSGEKLGAPKSVAPASNLIAMESEPSFSDTDLKADTLSLALDGLERFLLRQQEHLQEW